MVNVIRPRIVVCFSTDKSHTRVNFNRLQEFEGELGFAYSIMKNEDSGHRIGRVIVATPSAISFTDQERAIPVIFLQHASRIRRFDDWSNVLKNTVKHIDMCKM